ncbi:MAG: AAA family ATPase [Bacteroidia bacterium]
MQTVASKSLNPSPTSTPLVNLFAYIRDLFTHTRPSLRFDSDPQSPFWPLTHLSALSSHTHIAHLISCQWKDHNLPILKIQRIDNQAFEQDPERVRLYDQLVSQIHNQPLEEVQHLAFPSELDDWVSVSVEDGRVKVEKLGSTPDIFSALNLAYDTLHDLFYTLQSHPDRQICLSFGMLSGKIGGEWYQNFLFHIPLKISLKRQTITLEADTLAHVITCEQSFSDLLDEHFSREPEEKIQERKLRVLREVDHFNSQSREFSFEPDYIRGSFYESALKIAEVFPRVADRFFEGENLNFELPEKPAEGEIVLSFSPVIHVRDLATGVVIARDADKIIARINELGTKGENESIPDFFKKLFSLRKPGNPLRIAYRSENKLTGNLPAVYEALPERFLFPLPYNEEQLSIAQQLLRQDAVTVQGPPGTGKSHTIANLASHFVSEGKSILIVSKNAKALEVIKGKLPPAIRHLAVALLEGNQNQEELKHAIDAVKNHLNQRYDPAETARMEAELAALEAQTRQLRENLISRIGHNQRMLTLYDPRKKEIFTLPASSWAEVWDKIDRENVLIPDEISWETNTEGLAAELIHIRELLGKVSPEMAEMELPDAHIFPDLRRAKEMLDEWEKINSRTDLSAYTSVETHLLETDFPDLVKEMYEVWKEITTWQEVWRKPGLDVETLAPLFIRNRDLFFEAESEGKNLLNSEVRGLIWTDPDEMLDSLKKLREKFGESGRISLLQKKLLPENQRIFLSTTVNGREVSGTAELKVIEQMLVQQSRLKKLAIFLNNALAFSQTRVSADQALITFRQWDSLFSDLGKLAAFNQKLKNRNLPVVDIRSEKATAQWAFLLGSGDYLRSERMQAEWQEMIRPVLPYSSKNPVIGKIVGHWNTRNLTGVEMAMEELTQMREEKQIAIQLKKDIEKCRGILPLSIAEITAQNDNGWTQAELEMGIFTRKLESFLAETLDLMGDPIDIFSQLQENRIQQ